MNILFTGLMTTALSLHGFALMLRDRSQAIFITDDLEQLLNSYEAFK
jgi:hypothetical protein